MPGRAFQRQFAGDLLPFLRVNHKTDTTAGSRSPLDRARMRSARNGAGATVGFRRSALLAARKMPAWALKPDGLVNLNFSRPYATTGR